MRSIAVIRMTDALLLVLIIGHDSSVWLASTMAHGWNPLPMEDIALGLVSAKGIATQTASV
jgi:hypothetical protein